MNLSLPQITDPALLAELERHGVVQEFEPGQTIIAPEQSIKMVPIILEGSVKVMRTNGEGHDLLLYYLEGGDTCAVALTCCNTSSPSDVKAVAEEKTRVLGVPLQKHNEWTNTYRQWQEFVALTYQKRFQELLRAVDDVAFRKMDERLLRYLITKARQLNSLELSVTHQQIASELGTSREVISRLLKQLEKQKLVELERNRIFVRDDLEELLAAMTR
ncbi:Crp/Fnr family transcriptional regulator [Rufibacter psychrotolerans]|uniref:Crp/Fnr family transcriptional regulator n=1 Tax=Rufibacter psychrotolerans TaxID=2812556 RepID=UPI00196813A1|nr:Crp/Fnr family transcriptional regulator [Rufibacter sp. SYSU D00308]